MGHTASKDKQDTPELYHLENHKQNHNMVVNMGLQWMLIQQSVVLWIWKVDLKNFFSPVPT